jgi:hypothetical protein
MKKLLSTFFLLISIATFAQVEKGKYLIGGSVDISQLMQGEARNFNMSISPAFGVFVIKGLGIGGRYSFGVASRRVYNKKKEKYMPSTSFTTAIGPKVSYYIGKKAFKGLVSAYANYVVYTQLYNGNVTNLNGFSAGGFVGMAYFFNEHVAMESGMYLNGSGYKGEFPATRIGFSVGLAVVLDKKKQD